MMFSIARQRRIILSMHFYLHRFQLNYFLFEADDFLFTHHFLCLQFHQQFCMHVFKNKSKLFKILIYYSILLLQRLFKKNLRFSGKYSCLQFFPFKCIQTLTNESDILMSSYEDLWSWKNKFLQKASELIFQYLFSTYFERLNFVSVSS